MASDGNEYNIMELHEVPVTRFIGEPFQPGGPGRAFVLDLAEPYPESQFHPHMTLLYLSREVGPEEREQMAGAVSTFFRGKNLPLRCETRSMRKSDEIYGDLATLKEEIERRWPCHKTGRVAHVELRP